VALFYFGTRTDAPKPEKPWVSFAINGSNGLTTWLNVSGYATRDECAFEIGRFMKTASFYREPAGCLYQGYQNPYVLWVVNTFLEPGMWKCVARMKKREKYNEPVYQMILRDANADHTDTWECYL
jgi:hypothetical protein